MLAGLQAQTCTYEVFVSGEVYMIYWYICIYLHIYYVEPLVWGAKKIRHHPCTRKALLVTIHCSSLCVPRLFICSSCACVRVLPTYNTIITHCRRNTYDTHTSGSHGKGPALGSRLLIIALRMFCVQSSAGTYSVWPLSVSCLSIIRTAYLFVGEIEWLTIVMKMVDSNENGWHFTVTRVLPQSRGLIIARSIWLKLLFCFWMAY